MIPATLRLEVGVKGPRIDGLHDQSAYHQIVAQSCGEAIGATVTRYCGTFLRKPQTGSLKMDCLRRDSQRSVIPERGLAHRSPAPRPGSNR
jgi:hypothetical protein